MFKLFCIVVGEGRPFSVKIAADETVDDLKKKIKEEKMYQFPADELQLYLALKDGAWLSDEDPDVTSLFQPAEGNKVSPLYVNDERKMKTTRKLSKYFSGGQYPAFCDEERIHVLVVVPSQQSVVKHSRGIVCEIDFYNGIFNADVKGEWLHFIQMIPSSATEAKTLFVRRSYQIIASSIQSIQSIQKDGKNKIFKAIITGTPGVGKSFFLIYLLWNLVKAGKKVLFIYHPDIIYYDGFGGVFELREFPSAVEHSFWSDDLWCLFDVKGKNEGDLSAIPYDSCTVVLSTSPRRDMINDFKKPPVPEVFFMPLWTEPELEKIAVSFPQVVNWCYRFNILGGIPRMVLEDTKQEATKILEAACKQCELDDCIKIIGFDSTITEKSKVVHSLVHITSEHPFTTSSVCYASKAALDIIIRTKGVEAKKKMQ